MSAVFFARHIWFNMREQFSDLASGLVANALVPFFVWLMARVWERFNAAQGNFTLSEVVVYIGITELLFMTFLRMGSLNRASGDFSIALARPRSWLLMSFTGLVGRATGSRLMMLLVLAVTLPLLGAEFRTGEQALLRLALLLPWLAVLQGLCALLFASAQVLWHQTNYFLLPVGKVFLILGGVWGPLADFSEPWRSWILPLPPADLFFQPAYFCVKGEFWGISPLTWLLRTGALAGGLVLCNIYFYRVARRNHESYGG